ncbi:DUF938 domain-containing protein [Shimia marina]|uniref:Methyltransferase domain protein n=1 Tax=Shimia marina TaxID=321267 RepID=A0A0P1EUL0_9RHOB|nr:DUF938 domain-containing protein [Shimia marina]CUH54038.1 hypothetical protein SHM7688_03507 [Shimia marina]SFE16188.1 Protein of unknown function [Shimia marina]
MPRRLNLPDSASVATPDTAGKLFAPSAARNVTPLIDALAPLLPASGQVVEIASGTGQHIVAYAKAFPALIWQPTEIDASRRASIQAYVGETNLANLRPPQALDATAPGWSQDVSAPDVILLANLLHLISSKEAEVLISEAAKALSSGGHLLMYGPFKRNGQLVSEGDQRFDADLRNQDPEIGYKSDVDLADFAATRALLLAQTIEMPANNLLIKFTKS